jgi:uncharacterized repeat protein (TIGR03803 family)
MAIALNHLQLQHQPKAGRAAWAITMVAVGLTSVLCAHAASSEKVLETFQGVNGSFPESTLISDKAGNLYGTTTGGGVQGFGTVFKLSPESGHWRETILHRFSGTPDGKSPIGALVMDGAGNVYGTAPSGGNSTNSGIVFKVDPSGTESVIYSFSESDGAAPYCALILDSKGDIFGTTQSGGAYGNGTVFELMPGSGGTWTQKVLYSFTDNSGDGANPYAGVVMDEAGNLYGTTYSGGSGVGNGVVFELQPSGDNWNESLLYTFTGGSDGGAPFGGLTIHGGDLFGTTVRGGIGAGVVFELTPGSGGWSESVAYTFTGHPDGEEPGAGVIFDKAGNAYGTTVHGGWRYCAIGCGTIFKLAPKSGGGWQETVLYRFNGRGVGDGEYPAGGILLGNSKDQLYGTASDGGSRAHCYRRGCGIVFELTP